MYVPFISIYLLYPMYIQGISSCRYTTYILDIYQVYQQLFQTRFFGMPWQLVSVNEHVCVCDQEGVIPHATRATRPWGKGCQQKAQADLPFLPPLPAPQASFLLFATTTGLQGVASASAASSSPPAALASSLSSS